MYFSTMESKVLLILSFGTTNTNTRDLHIGPGQVIFILCSVRVLKFKRSSVQDSFHCLF